MRWIELHCCWVQRSRDTSPWRLASLDALVPSLAFAVAFVALWWLIVYSMDRRRIYLKL